MISLMIWLKKTFIHIRNSQIQIKEEAQTFFLRQLLENPAIWEHMQEDEWITDECKCIQVKGLIMVQTFNFGWNHLEQ